MTPERQEHIRDSFDKFGSAQSRYVDNSEISWREEVAIELRRYATDYRKKYKLTGSEYFERKAAKLERQAVRFRYCGYEYVVLKCKDCDKSYLGASRCESRLCKKCSSKHGARVRKRQLRIIKTLVIGRGYQLAFLTLTKKVNPLRPPNEFDIREVSKCTRKLINKLYPKKLGRGAFSTIEVGENNNIHVHLLVYGPFIPQDRISDLWLRITGDSKIVDIRSVRSPIKCVNYLLKYISKPPCYQDPRKYAQYIDSITGVRRIHTYGIFYNCPLMKKESCPCAVCGGKLQFNGTDGGMNIPLEAIFLNEIMNLHNQNS